MRLLTDLPSAHPLFPKKGSRPLHEQRQAFHAYPLPTGLQPAQRETSQATKRTQFLKCHPPGHKKVVSVQPYPNESHQTVSNSARFRQQGHRFEATRLARKRGAARVLAAAERKMRAAAEKAEAREQTTASVRGKLRGQEEADRAALEVGVARS